MRWRGWDASQARYQVLEQVSWDLSLEVSSKRFFGECEIDGAPDALEHLERRFRQLAELGLY